MTKTFRFIINPEPKVRMTRGSKFSARAKECLEYQDAIAKLAQYHKVPKFEKQDVIFHTITFVRAGRRCDIDNLLKAFFDGLQYGQVFKNDNQIRGFDCVRVIYLSAKDTIDPQIQFEISKFIN